MTKNVLIALDTPVQRCGDVKKQYEQYYRDGVNKLVSADGKELKLLSK